MCMLYFSKEFSFIIYLPNSKVVLLIQHAYPQGSSVAVSYGQLNQSGCPPHFLNTIFM